MPNIITSLLQELFYDDITKSLSTGNTDTSIMSKWNNFAFHNKAVTNPRASIYQSSLYHDANWAESIIKNEQYAVSQNTLADYLNDEQGVHRFSNDTEKIQEVGKNYLSSLVSDKHVNPSVIRNDIYDIIDWIDELDEEKTHTQKKAIIFMHAKILHEWVHAVDTLDQESSKALFKLLKPLCGLCRYCLEFNEDGDEYLDEDRITTLIELFAENVFIDDEEIDSVYDLLEGDGDYSVNISCTEGLLERTYTRGYAMYLSTIEAPRTDKEKASEAIKEISRQYANNCLTYENNPEDIIILLLTHALARSVGKNIENYTEDVLLESCLQDLCEAAASTDPLEIIKVALDNKVAIQNIIRACVEVLLEAGVDENHAKDILFSAVLSAKDTQDDRTNFKHKWGQIVATAIYYLGNNKKLTEKKLPMTKDQLTLAIQNRWVEPLKTAVKRLLILDDKAIRQAILSVEEKKVHFSIPPIYDAPEQWCRLIENQVIPYSCISSEQQALQLYTNRTEAFSSADCDNYTLLEVAINRSWNALACELINNVEDKKLDELIENEKYILHAAIKAKQPAVINALVKKLSISSICKTDNSHNTILHTMASMFLESEYKDNEDVEKLVLSLIDILPKEIIAQTNLNGETALHIFSIKEEGTPARCTKIQLALLDKMNKEDLGIRCFNPGSCLLQNLTREEIETEEQQKTFTILHIALVSNCDNTFIKALINKMCYKDIEACTFLQQNALHYAAWAGNAEVIEFLLTQGQIQNMLSKRDCIHLLPINFAVERASYLQECDLHDKLMNTLKVMEDHIADNALLLDVVQIDDENAETFQNNIFMTMMFSGYMDTAEKIALRLSEKEVIDELNKVVGVAYSESNSLYRDNSNHLEQGLKKRITRIITTRFRSQTSNHWHHISRLADVFLHSEKIGMRKFGAYAIMEYVKAHNLDKLSKANSEVTDEVLIDQLTRIIRLFDAARENADFITNKEESEDDWKTKSYIKLVFASQYGLIKTTNSKLYFNKVVTCINKTFSTEITPAMIKEVVTDYLTTHGNKVTKENTHQLMQIQSSHELVKTMDKYISVMGEENSCLKFWELVIKSKFNVIKIKPHYEGYFLNICKMMACFSSNNITNLTIARNVFNDYLRGYEQDTSLLKYIRKASSDKVVTILHQIDNVMRVNEDLIAPDVTDFMTKIVLEKFYYHRCLDAEYKKFISLVEALNEQNMSYHAMKNICRGYVKMSKQNIDELAWCNKDNTSIHSDLICRLIRDVVSCQAKKRPLLNQSMFDAQELEHKKARFLGQGSENDVEGVNMMYAFTALEPLCL